MMRKSLTRKATAVAAAAVFGAFALSAAPAAPGAKSALAAVSDAQLALRWAPVHYQDTDSTDYDADYLTAVDYDGDWDTLNNWEHQDDSLSQLKGTVYYSVVETSTHWFLTYSFYHPRDWVDYPDFGLDTHENDMEGLLLTVRKDGTDYGKLEAMVTVAHSDFYSYTPPGSAYTAGQETIDGAVVMANYGGFSRPTSFQEAKGHGLKAWNGGSFPGGDGIVYYPSAATAEVPSGGSDSSVQYRLVDAFASGGLWSRRYDAVTFASWGTFRGDNGKDNSANAAWGWDDGNDSIARGEMATDPAKLVSAYFGNLGNFSTAYTRNGYR
ncbi:hypothetical protein [Paenibacillus xanthanilyticus]|uniref:Uncharacterized protein n=1 Tax=Paenibacillus xanthanilyticus TaxID=1783531 RepID=A0ABV8K442_9BACL